VFLSQDKEINVFTFLKRLPQSTIVGLSGLILATLLAASVALLVSPNLLPHTALAATSPTCAQSPTAKHCNNQDPEKQGCAEDNAATILQADIVKNGVTVGRVERRFSLKCSSWWGRVLDYQQGSQAKMSISIAGGTPSPFPIFVGKSLRILYSPMVFDATPTQTVPAITGSLSINGIPVSATIPAIVIPAK
jgi:hypothetical protein